MRAGFRWGRVVKVEEEINIPWHCAAICYACRVEGGICVRG